MWRTPKLLFRYLNDPRSHGITRAGPCFWSAIPGGSVRTNLKTFPHFTSDSLASAEQLATTMLPFGFGKKQAIQSLLKTLTSNEVSDFVGRTG
jgi:hypothetical protein